MPGPRQKKSNQKLAGENKTVATKRSAQASCPDETGRTNAIATTERLQLDALRVRTERLLSMVEHLPAGAVYRDHDHLMMNRAAEKITGYGRDELTTLDQWFEKLYGKHKTEQRQSYEIERKAGFPKQTEPLAITCKNGKQRFVEFAAYKFDGSEVWIMHDVTARYESQVTLSDREARLRAVMDNAAEAIIVIGNDGLITDFNNAAVLLFGYAANEVIGHNVCQLMPSPYREAHDGYIRRYLKTGEQQVINQLREMPGRRKDGSIFALELTVTELQGLGAFVGIMRDLSKQRQLEKQIADVSTQEQERIGQEIHDGLGQQLTGLSMMATSIKHKLEHQNNLVAEQMEELIKQLQLATREARALSRGLAPVPVTPEGLADALTLLARDVKARSGIDCHFEAHDAVEIKDRTSAMQIYRIAQEAVNNAIKHAHTTLININLDTRDGECILTVRDNGRGFQRNETINEGLGMRIMNYRASLIGCHLSIESSPGKGTTVRCKRVNPDPIIQ